MHKLTQLLNISNIYTVLCVKIICGVKEHANYNTLGSRRFEKTNGRRKRNKLVGSSKRSYKKQAGTSKAYERNNFEIQLDRERSNRIREEDKQISPRQAQKLVIDANIVISALIAKRGITRELIFDERLVLIAPEFLLEEIENHKDEILKKSRLLERDLKTFLRLMKDRVQFSSKASFEKYVKKARSITPDPKDTEYFAIALKEMCSIWSDDKELKEQSKVGVLNTEEIIKLFYY